MLGFWFYVDFFLNLRFYYYIVEYRHQYLNKQHISKRKHPCFIVQRIYDAVTRRATISNAGIEGVGSPSQEALPARLLCE